MRETNVPFLRGVAVILRRIAESTRFFVLDGEIEAGALPGDRAGLRRSGEFPGGSEFAPTTAPRDHTAARRARTVHHTKG